jgi:hypothetical protein
MQGRAWSGFTLPYTGFPSPFSTRSVLNILQGIVVSLFAEESFRCMCRHCAQLDIPVSQLEPEFRGRVPIRIGRKHEGAGSRGRCERACVLREPQPRDDQALRQTLQSTTMHQQVAWDEDVAERRTKAKGSTANVSTTKVSPKGLRPLRLITPETPNPRRPIHEISEDSTTALMIFV